MIFFLNQRSILSKSHSTEIIHFNRARFRLLQKNRALKNLIENIDEYDAVGFLKHVSHVDSPI
jgi:hypothetical protein